VITLALHLAAGGVLALAAWLIPRRVAEARAAKSATLLLDVLPLLLIGTLVLTATGRPIFTGVLLVSLGAGFALADRTKRTALREPIVFSETSEMPHLFTHPQLYLPFAGPALVIGGAATALIVCLALLSFEPGLWDPDPVLVFSGGGLVLGSAWLVSREPALGRVASALRRLGATGEPFSDAAALGPFAMFFVYGVIARAERATRQARFAPLPAPAFQQPHWRTGVPLILVQCESFFDARRVSPLIPDTLLLGYDECCARGGTFGRLDVPGWGANTMRAEFAVLTGIPDRELGYDRFNPYHAFARAPIASLAWELRSQGYRTVCLHPFDRNFFRRDLALPALGFETFLGIESLGGSRRPPYYADSDLAHDVLRVLENEGPRVFIFAITMGNHGPWLEAGFPIDPELRRSFDLTSFPQGEELLRYLGGLRKSDEMLQILLSELQRCRHESVLAFYGDHLPSLPDAFHHFGFEEWASDYVVWRDTGLPARQLDLPAHQLATIIIDALQQKGVIDRRGTAALVPNC
jgi:Sulfatase